jgi:xanthine dehydrogenase YagS FAD-binding subunit
VQRSTACLYERYPMRPFEFVEPTTAAEVIHLLQMGAGQARPMAGGSDLLGELKDEVVHYERLVSLAGLAELRAVHQDEAGLRLGALVTLTELEYEPRFHGPYRLLAEAARSVATPEIRNQGTLGGNLCQRPRCLYYRSALISCLKKGGTDCPALAGPYQDYLSIMGGHGCFIVHASDLAPPLIVLGASVILTGPGGERTLLIEQFFAGPERDVHRENVLAHDEIVTAVTIPAPAAHWRGTYLKARERTAGDFPLVSVAVGYGLEDGAIQHVRLVLGGVAPIPWRSPQAEAVLTGQAPSPELAARAAEVALAEARPLPHNAFKVDIGRALIARAIMAVATM